MRVRVLAVILAATLCACSSDDSDSAPPTPTGALVATPTPTGALPAATPTLTGALLAATPTPTGAPLATPTRTGALLATPTRTSELQATPTPTSKPLATPTPTSELQTTATPTGELQATPTPTAELPLTVAVLSAFPAELAAVLEHTTVTETVMVDGRVFRKGTLAGVPVVVAMTGIGLLNAAATTQAILQQFPVRGVIVSGVAGSSRQIGDVTVPATWVLMNGPSFAADPDWLALADQIAAPGATALERCTRVTQPPQPDPVCFPNPPSIAVGGVGHSSDPFGDKPPKCTANGGDVFGCDVAPPTPTPAALSARAGGLTATIAALDTEPPIAEDMETAAIAREAAARGLKFIAFRAVSDGAGDPLGLPGFPTQFFAYYRFAAHNAAAAAAAFLERLAAG